MTSTNRGVGVRLIAEVWRRFNSDDCPDLAAQVSFALFVLVSFALWNLGHLLAAIVSKDLQVFVLFESQWTFARWIATFGLMCVGISLINHFLPAAHRPWRWLTPGTIFVAVSFIVATIAFEIYLAHGANVSALYGALGGFMVLMLWIYLANLMLLIGVETDTALRELKLAGS